MAPLRRQKWQHRGHYLINPWPSQTTLQQNCLNSFHLNQFTSLKHVANNFKLPQWQQKRTTQWSKSNQSMAIPNNTLLLNFSEIGPVVFPKTCLQTKKTLPTNWATEWWQLGNNLIQQR